MKDKVGELLQPRHVGPWPEVRDQLNRILRGWSGYFGHGTRLAAYTAIDRHVHDRVRHFLARRHKVPGRGTRQYSRAEVFGNSVSCASLSGNVVGLDMKPVGEPDAGNPHVRFDERGEETE